MFNADRLLFDLIGGGLSGGGLGRKRYRYRHGRGMGDAIGRTVMSPQGLTILGGLAIAAYEHFKGAPNAGGAGQPGGAATAGQPAQPTQPGIGGTGASLPANALDSSTPPAMPPPFVLPAAGAEAPAAGGMGGVDEPAAGAAPAGETRARLLITAMVSAAKADGTIDADERARILGQLAERGAGDAERAYLEEEMARPLDLDRLVAQVHDPVLAAEVYAASLLAIDPDTPAETAYLAMLATRLNLDPGMVREVESRLDAAGA